MLNVENLGKNYGGHEVVRKVGFSIDNGEAVGLLGANGAGKSTLIKSILDLVHADTGSIRIDGSFAYLPELPQLPLSLTALQLLSFKSRACDLPASSISEAFSASGLQECDLNRPVRSFSKGMKQRVSLALTLCGNPGLMLLDEPMSGLDALGRAEILHLLQQRKDDGTAILMSSHIVTDMVRLCDRVMIMAGGQIREQIDICDHSLAEAEMLEQRLAHWNSGGAA